MKKIVYFCYTNCWMSFSGHSRCLCIALHVWLSYIHIFRLCGFIDFIPLRWWLGDRKDIRPVKNLHQQLPVVLWWKSCGRCDLTCSDLWNKLTNYVKTESSSSSSFVVSSCCFMICYDLPHSSLQLMYQFTDDWLCGIRGKISQLLCT